MKLITLKRPGDRDYSRMYEHAESRGEVIEFGRSYGRAKAGERAEAKQVPYMASVTANEKLELRNNAPLGSDAEPNAMTSPAINALWASAHIRAHKNADGTFNNGPQEKKWSWRVLLALLTAFGLSVYSVGKALGAW